MSADAQLSFGIEAGDAPEPEQPAATAPPTSGEAESAPPFPPTSEQAEAISARDRDVFLEAGAGTGKTRVLVDRYCDAVDIDGVEPERILAFTFTDKAAAEMRRRVRVELARRARAATDPERATRLQQAARAGEAAPITTIHGFCRRLLGSHPIAAGLDPRFRVLDADEAGRLGSIAFDRALAELAGTDDEVARTAAGYRNRLFGLIAGAHSDLRNRGQMRPQLPPLQITAFDRSEQTADPAEIEIATTSYEALRALLVVFGERYEEIKGERSGVDFDDLQLLALELLRTSAAIATSYRERYDHLLVDEFQDTSPIQVDLVNAIKGPATRLFTVGDEFQSIYAFRGADLASFRAERERFRASGRDAAILPLSGSFRSSPDVVAAVNAVGAALLTDFRPLRVGRPPESAPGGPDGAVVELLLTERKGWNEDGISISTAAAETPANRIAEARFLAARLRELADDGVEPASMVLLLRAFSHVDAYAEALELAGLEPYVVGGRGYWSAQQVEDALRLLRCVANPLDDEALFGALASPACALSPDALWILRRAAGRSRSGRGWNHVWPAIERLLPPSPDRKDASPESDRGDPSVAEQPHPEEAEADPEEAERRREAEEWAARLPAADRGPLERFAEQLIALREQAPLLPLDSLVEHTLEAFGYDLAALAMPGGSRRAANLAKLVRIAAEYESHEGRDLRGFLAYAADRAARSDREAEAAVAAEDHAGVRVMTVHAAKGLEFECVAVADLGRGMASGGMQPELRLAFGQSDGGAGEQEATPQIGLRLSRPGAGVLDLAGYKALNDDAADAEAEETGRLAYVAASRARERLILSGLFDPEDVGGGRAEIKPSHSAFARILPALGATGADGELLQAPAAEPRAEIDATFEPATIWASVIEASAESAKRLAYDHRPPPGDAGPAPGGRPPMLALAERSGSAARSLSYAALADYQRCGYRFLVERVLGLGSDVAASGPMEPTADADAPDAPDLDTDHFDPEPHAEPDPGLAAAGRRRSRLGFGRAVHELLEASARSDWERPDEEQIVAALAAHGSDPAGADRADELISGWLASPLLAELRAAGASFRPEVPFRLALGEQTVLRGTIDLLATVPDGPPVIIDYKTDATGRSGAPELAEGYLLQRALYALAISEATGAERLESAYVFLEQPGNPVRETFDPAAIAAGRDRIEALIGRIRAREYAVTDNPHAALCHDCPARPRLCPYPRERTLARRE